MRQLVLTVLLAGGVAACQDAAAPRDDRGASLATATAPAAARLDLRRERTALIAAGNAVSQAIASHGVAAGLTAAFAPKVILLSPRVNIITGKPAAAAFLASDALRPQALDWHIIVADLSSDGSQGFTWGEGSSTYDLGTGPTARPSFVLIYWRRVGDDWKIAAMNINAGGPQTDPIPAGFGTPHTETGLTFPNSDPAVQRERLLSRDRAFSQASVVKGSGPAFERFAAPNAIGVSGAFVFGPHALGEAFSSDPKDVISWIPRLSDVAGSGDLGFTVGEATFQLVQFGTFYSKYLTVWQKLEPGGWKYVADFGSSRPAP
jgi:ketosteroid isomerase-like protein